MGKNTWLFPHHFSSPGPIIKTREEFSFPDARSPLPKRRRLAYFRMNYSGGMSFAQDSFQKRNEQHRNKFLRREI
jgi:hypothetical protein